MCCCYGDSLCHQDRKDDVFIGKVWPGYTAYPDFAYPLTTEYWTKQVCE